MRSCASSGGAGVGAHSDVAMGSPSWIDAVGEWAKRDGGRLPGLRTSPPLRVERKFSIGQSNPSYLLEQAGQRWVLRRQPPPPLLPSAHAVDREHAIQKALRLRAPGTVHVPEVYALCEDRGVLGGSMFYTMEFVDGITHQDPALPGCSGSDRALLYAGMAQQLAALHAVDVTEIAPALPERMRPDPKRLAEPYGLRTLRVWKRQYLASCRAAREEPLPAALELAALLESHPPEPEGGSASSLVIIHGDWRIDNIIFDDRHAVRAVLDWELSTIATADQAMADVAYACLPHYLPNALSRLGLGTVGNASEGIPSPDEFVLHYLNAKAEAEGARTAAVDSGAGASVVASSRWRWFVALALFRVAAILAGVGARAKTGNASSDHAARIGSREVQSAIFLRALDVLGKGKVHSLAHALSTFMEEHVMPAEEALLAHSRGHRRWEENPTVETLKLKAREAGLWNLFITPELASLAERKLKQAGVVMDAEEWNMLFPPPISHRDYTILCEIMGQTPFAAEIFNCSAPDTGNMEVLAKHGKPAQVKQWLLPLLQGRIRSSFCMTEPSVASSDATNISATITRTSDGVVVNGTKWWITGAMHPRCEVCLFLGADKDARPGGSVRKSKTFSIVVVPMNTRGVTVVKPLDVFGEEDAPSGHAVVDFANVAMPPTAFLGKPGAAFAIAQTRLGPGRLHHCGRALGMAERALRLAVARARERTPFGKPIASHGGFQNDLAKAIAALDQARLLVRDAATRLDATGGDASFKSVRAALSLTKLVVPTACLRCVDFAQQVHGAGGLNKDTILPALWVGLRALRIADGPDAVHEAFVARTAMSKL